MRPLVHPSIDSLELTLILGALADPIRLQIIYQLSQAQEKEIMCSECCLNMSKPAMSHHFKVLRLAGLIHVRLEGKKRFLSIRREDIEKRFPGVLDAVLSAAEKNQAKP